MSSLRLSALFCFLLFAAVPCMAQEAKTQAAPQEAGAPPVAAAPVPAPLAAPAASAPAAPALAPVLFAPHKATYKMVLGKAKVGSGIGAVSGTMVFDGQDVCDGWAIQQNMQLQFLYSEGDESSVSSPAVTWEAKDGSAFHFHVMHMVGDQEEEGFKGRVKRDDKGVGLAHYTMPLDKKDVEVAKDAIFPTAHTLMILKKAQAGEKMFTQKVFDGADDAGAVDISAFIGPRIDKLDDQTLAPEVRGNPLLTQEAWPTRMAFYKPESPSSEPDYEMDLLLQPNGIVRSITIDYGDFTIQGTLVKLEPHTTLNCSGDQKTP